MEQDHIRSIAEFVESETEKNGSACTCFERYRPEASACATARSKREDLGDRKEEALFERVAALLWARI